jgi:hypothetical protein
MAHHMGIPCITCGFMHDIDEILSNCSISWPNQRWALFTCPRCGASSHLQFSNGMVETGYVDGGPGPCFFPEGAYKVAGLSIRKEPDALTVRAGRRAKRIPAKQ